MTPALYDALLDLLVRRLDDIVPAAELVAWATIALEQGIETDALVDLAGLARDCSAHEAAVLLDKTISQLHLNVPAGEALRRAYVGAVSRAVLAGSLPAEDALERIHRRAVTPLGHPPDLAPWCFVWEGLHPDDYETLTPSQQEELALHLARTWASFPPGFSEAAPSGSP
jgi:hypothetical protein